MTVSGIFVKDGVRQRQSWDSPVAGDTLYYNGTELVRVAIGGAGTVLKSTGTAPAWDTFLEKKAGRVLAASFTGDPRQATVTFSTAFSDANYAVKVTPVTANDVGFAPFVESQLAGSFVINLGTSVVTDLTQVNWVAVKDGET